MIIKQKSGKYNLFSRRTHRHLGSFTSLKAAKNRERQINYFKNKN